MTRLRLKRTPAEEHERARREAYKAAKKAAKRRRSGDMDDSNPEAGPSHRGKHNPAAAFGDDDVYGPTPPLTPSHKPDYDAIRAEMEEMLFREKMRDALDDDERLDGIDARFNDYAHIPDRWSRDKHDAVDPQYMDDDEYAEWVREGMWKKMHAREYEEQVRRDAEKAARKAREKEVKAQTTRMERLAFEQEERRRKERRRQREEEYRRRYEQQWKVLLDPQMRDDGPLTFEDIPWPLLSTHSAKLKASVGDLSHVEEITPEAVSAFLVPDAMATSTKSDNVSRRNRDKLKETLLRFHPDKFEARFMRRVPETEREGIREAVGQVTRALNTLMSEQ